MDGSAFVLVGRVAKTHGLKGEVSAIESAGISFSDLEGTELWFVPPGDGPNHAILESTRPGPKGPLLTLFGFDDADSAASLRGKDVLVRASDVPEDYAAPLDPVGLRVVDDLRGPIGTVTDVIVTGANDVWVVEGEAYGQVLVPVIEQVVHTINAEEGCAFVHLLPGLIEDE